MPSKRVNSFWRIDSDGRALFHSEFIQCDWKNDYKFKMYVRPWHRGGQGEQSKVEVGAGFQESKGKWLMVSPKVGFFPLEKKS